MHRKGRERRVDLEIMQYAAVDENEIIGTQRDASVREKHAAMAFFNKEELCHILMRFECTKGCHMVDGFNGFKIRAAAGLEYRSFWGSDGNDRHSVRPFCVKILENLCKKQKL